MPIHNWGYGERKGSESAVSGIYATQRAGPLSLRVLNFKTSSLSSSFVYEEKRFFFCFRLVI